MKNSIEIITPKIAAQMLTRNERNRRMSRVTVEEYKDSMIKGAWHQTGEAIKFAKGGRLIDGQHRLQALAELDGKVSSLPFLVVRDLPDEAQKKMDRGRRRVVADELTMDGVPNASTVVSTVRTTLLVQTGAIFLSSKEHRKIGYASEQDVLEYVKANPGVVDYVSAHSAVRKVFHRGGLMTGALWMVAETGHEATEEFTQKLITGSMLAPLNPVLTLRERLANIRAERTSYSDKEILYFVFRSWIAFRDGKELSKLQLPKGGVNQLNWVSP